MKKRIGLFVIVLALLLCVSFPAAAAESLSSASSTQSASSLASSSQVVSSQASTGGFDLSYAPTYMIGFAVVLMVLTAIVTLRNKK